MQPFLRHGNSSIAGDLELGAAPDDVDGLDFGVCGAFDARALPVIFGGMRGKTRGTIGETRGDLTDTRTIVLNEDKLKSSVRIYNRQAGEIAKHLQCY